MKTVPTVWKRIELKETEEEIMAMTRYEVTAELTEKEIKFCNYLTGNHNIRIAAIKAGYSPQSAHITGWKVRQKYEVNLYISWLKLKAAKECHIDAMDLLDGYTRQAFADINDFLEVKGNKVKLKDSLYWDGQLVKSVKSTINGVSLELVDRQTAFEKLIRYFDFLPADWKQKIEERKLELYEQKLELERQRMGISDEEIQDDGFLDALKDVAVEVWANEDEGEDDYDEDAEEE